ncbi:hypothetical protein ACFJGV_12525 [Cnuibacter sp. UC19_7]|uniref:hypothetical protein n=1 Tax=Cnuibacter sp. UC19_7 TaxID=3350166 RepID=UPI00366D3469
MRIRGTALLVGAGVLVAVAAGTGFALAANGLGEHAGTPIGVDAVTVDTPATTPPPTPAVPSAGPTPGEGGPPVVTVPEPSPVPADDHGGDRPGKGGEDDSSGSGSSGGGHGTDD